jgi:ATP-dependent DNA helicase RecG
MSDKQKNKLMDEFNSGEIDILVATSVIEVGVNVINASVMIVESAERFGLAQLHQLRGRVGRAGHQSHCILITTSAQRPPRRLQALTTSSSGFELAELDLELRGPGAIYGTRQHGSLDMKLADFSDIELLTIAKNAARKFHETSPDLLQYPQLAETVNNFRAITHLN